MAGKILIGSRLPNGVVLQHPDKKDLKVTVAGVNSSKIIGASHYTTEVDSDFWNAWKAKYKDLPMLKNNAIFEASGERDAKDKGKELKNEKTGFEQLDPKASGVKPADKE